MSRSLRYQVKKIMAKESTDTKIALIVQQLGTIERDIREIKLSLERNYVTQDQLAPVKKDVAEQRKLIFSVITIIVVAVIGAVLNLVIRQ